MSAKNSPELRLLLKQKIIHYIEQSEGRKLAPSEVEYVVWKDRRFRVQSRPSEDEVEILVKPLSGKTMIIQSSETQTALAGQGIDYFRKNSIGSFTFHR